MWQVAHFRADEQLLALQDLLIPEVPPGRYGTQSVVAIEVFKIRIGQFIAGATKFGLVRATVGIRVDRGGGTHGVVEPSGDLMLQAGLTGFLAEASHAHLAVLRIGDQAHLAAVLGGQSCDVAFVHRFQQAHADGLRHGKPDRVELGDNTSELVIGLLQGKRCPVAVGAVGLCPFADAHATFGSSAFGGLRLKHGAELGMGRALGVAADLDQILQQRLARGRRHGPGTGDAAAFGKARTKFADHFRKDRILRLRMGAGAEIGFGQVPAQHPRLRINRRHVRRQLVEEPLRLVRIRLVRCRAPP